MKWWWWYTGVCEWGVHGGWWWCKESNFAWGVVCGGMLHGGMVHSGEFARGGAWVMMHRGVCCMGLCCIGICCMQLYIAQGMLHRRNVSQVCVLHGGAFYGGSVAWGQQPL